MGIQSSLYSGVSGLNANGNALTVLGNNIANSNTIGFKASRTVFSDLLSAEIAGSGGSSQVGRGTGMSTVDNIFSQGTFESTESNTDLAIEGPGFFMVSAPDEATVNYTRAGSFRFNEEGTLVTPEGYAVQGYYLTEDGDTMGDITDMSIGSRSFAPANPTTAITLATNLNANDSYLGTNGDGVSPFDITDPAATSNYASSVRIFDTLGQEHLVTTYFNKLDPDNNPTGIMQWESHTVVAGSEVTDVVPIPDWVEAGRSVLSFDTGGRLVNVKEIAPTAGTYAGTSDTAATSGTAILTVADDTEANNITGMTITIDGAPTTIDNAAVSAATGGTLADWSAVTTLAELNSVLNGIVGVSSEVTATGIAISSDTTGASSAVVLTSAGGAAIPGAAAAGHDFVAGTATTTDRSYAAAGNLYETITPGAYPLTTDIELLDPQPTISTEAGMMAWLNESDSEQSFALSFDATQYSSESDVISQTQNGYGTGTLVSLSIDNDGNILGNYSNGEPRKLAKIALAKFTNPLGLSKVGNNMYGATDVSGTAVVGTVGSGVGQIFTNSLEMSNVDLAAEFVKMITTQRGFQANSKIITTVDELLGELINLKR